MERVDDEELFGQSKVEHVRSVWQHILVHDAFFRDCKVKPWYHIASVYCVVDLEGRGYVALEVHETLYGS